MTTPEDIAAFLFEVETRASKAPLDNVVDMLMCARRSDDSRSVFTFRDPGEPVECSTALFVGTLRQSFRSTCHVALCS